QREALTLCALEGMTNIEAAAVMDVSVRALESLLARARRALRAGLGAELAGER
ncbi:MAG: sigma factor-like helix-turn-helix DNA-binding protein, partial [Pseudomonadota bacterium]